MLAGSSIPAICLFSPLISRPSCSRVLSPFPSYFSHSFSSGMWMVCPLSYKMASEANSTNHITRSGWVSGLTFQSRNSGICELKKKTKKTPPYCVWTAFPILFLRDHCGLVPKQKLKLLLGSHKGKQAIPLAIQGDLRRRNFLLSFVLSCTSFTNIPRWFLKQHFAYMYFASNSQYFYHSLCDQLGQYFPHESYVCS